MRKKFSRRKKISEPDKLQIGQVLLTKYQLNKLYENYGEDLTNFAIRLLNEKINSNRNDKSLILATNHYQYFRKDGKIINFALEIMNNLGECGRVLY